jgi:parallel beta-helix repeat protein
MLRKTFLVVLLLFIIFIGWWVYHSIPDRYDPDRLFEDIQDDLMTQFIIAQDSSIIELPVGHFIFNRSLALEGVNHVTIRGKGIDKTVLSFKDQKEGAEGIRISNSSNITLEDFTVEDAVGDNIKVMDTDGITFRRVKAAWTGPITTENGSYGLYPVICTNVLIEECEAMGSSDAGIYVGQSEKVVIRNNKAYQNVAGIESENSDDVLIYGNEAYDNTGGILVFNLPGLTRYGKNIKVYDNTVTSNNRKNFGMQGAIVSNIPGGTGMLVLATNDVEIYNNTISDHRTLGIGVISYNLVEAMEEDIDADPVNAYGGVRSVTDFRNDLNYDPFPGQIHLHDNVYENAAWIPNITSDFGKLFLFKRGFGIPDVVLDGFKSPDYIKDGKLNPYYKICVDERDIKFLALDAENDFRELSEDITDYLCTEALSSAY